MKESDLTTKVSELCDKHRCYWFHIPDSRRVPSAKGVPDFFIAGTHHAIWRELKVDGNTPEGQQARWIYRLKAAGQNVKVWTERDYESGLIDKELAALNKP